MKEITRGKCSKKLSSLTGCFWLFQNIFSRRFYQVPEGLAALIQELVKNIKDFAINQFSLNKECQPKKGNCYSVNLSKRLR
jgi:hypothetical protein